MNTISKLFDFTPHHVDTLKDNEACRDAFLHLAHIGSRGIENADPKDMYQYLKKTLDCDHLTSEDFRRVRKDMSHMIRFDTYEQAYRFSYTTYPMMFAHLEHHARRLLDDV